MKLDDLLILKAWLSALTHASQLDLSARCTKYSLWWLGLADGNDVNELPKEGTNFPPQSARGSHVYIVISFKHPFLLSLNDSTFFVNVMIMYDMLHTLTIPYQSFRAQMRPI